MANNSKKGQSHESGDPDDRPNTASSLKLPAFWNEQPELWFSQIEAQFQLYQIKADKDKYFLVISALKEESLKAISDILKNPQQGSYNVIKKALIERFSCTEDLKFRKLFNGMELGDKLPSQLLREIKDLAGTLLTEPAIKRLWLNALPPQAQSILQSCNTPLDDLSSVADSIIDNCRQSVAACSETSELKELVKQLQSEIAELKQQNRRRSSSPAPRQNKSNTYCWYHHKYGKQAKRCTQPCSFRKSEN